MRLVDADALLKKQRHYQLCGENNEFYGSEDVVLVKDVEAAPTVEIHSSYTYSDVLNGLEIRAGRMGGKVQIDEALRVAALAIMKQVPVVPYQDNENGIYEDDCCPTCHRKLFPYEHHCRCGQAINWEGM